MDITSIFKARLEIVRNRQKALGTILPGETGGNGTSPPTVGKSMLLSNRKSEYFSKARDLLGTIRNLQEYLVEVRISYLSLGSTSCLSERSTSKFRRRTEAPVVLTDTEKEQVDLSVQKIIQNCHKRISEFQHFIEVREVESRYPQLYVHLCNVLNSLRDYLKEVCGNYAEMRAIRVKRTIDAQAMARMSSSKTPGPFINSSDNKDHLPNLQISQEELDGTGPTSSDPLASLYPDEEYSAEELQMFEAENSVLLRNLHTVADEVDQIETSIVQIAQLQEVFMEKVMVQNQDIDQIADVVIGATENIKGGNEQIRQAIQQNADFRAWVLFFIIVMSLSLLFLDWYND